MKNLFKKESNSGFWIAAGLTGLIAAGTAAWYFMRRSAGPKQRNEHALDYLKPPPPLHKKKTDLHDLHVIAGA